MQPLDEPRPLGDYMLLALLGSGATSDVYAASHPRLGSSLALKLLREGDAASDLGEIRAVQGVRHENVVRVLDAGRDPASNRAFVVMERVTGEDLATRLGRGVLAEPAVRALGAALADGMHAVHARGLVHRDLKPANVMLEGDVPRIVDFGIAKLLGGAAAAITSRRIGSPAYMAPEQLSGGVVAPSVDIWALGVILFEAATGTLPFSGFADGRCPQLFERAPSATGVSPALARLVARCLEREPALRPRTMDALARALRGEADGDDERITQDVAPPATSAPRAPRRRWLPPVAIGLAITTGVIASFFVGRDDAAPAPAAAATPALAPAIAPAIAPATEPEPEPEPEPAPAPASTTATEPARPGRPARNRSTGRKAKRPVTGAKKETLD